MKRSSRSFLAPEVIQSSAMDCGPAVLKCLLAGYGIEVSYDRLREACQTDVDGTSIDSLEDVARSLGLEVAQHILPFDGALRAVEPHTPCLLVTRTPTGGGHFVVLWGKAMGRFQCMDPGVGRVWRRPDALGREMLLHRHRLNAEDWFEFARNGPFYPWLTGRLANLGLGKKADVFLDRTISASGWRGLAATDAAARVVMGVVRAGGLKRGRQAVLALERCLDVAFADFDRTRRSLQGERWFAYPVPNTGGAPPEVLMSGAVLLIPSGVKAPSAVPAASKKKRPKVLDAALTERPTMPIRELVTLLRREDALGAAMLGAGLVLGVGGALAELMIFRASFSLIDRLGVVQQRLAAAGAFILFVAILFILEMLIASSSRRLGRHLEGRLRVALLTKLAKLIDSYFRSRLTSDMAQRVHGIQTVRDAPVLAQTLVRSSLDLLVTVGAICILQPRVALLAVAGAGLSIALPMLLRATMTERDMRVQTQTGAMSRLYLDALAGLVPLRMHSAEGAIAKEHEGLLVEWLRAAQGRQRMLISTSSLQSLLGVGVSTSLVYYFMKWVGEPQGLLLLLFWAQRIPALGQSIVSSVMAYAPMRNRLLRLLEPLRGEDRPDLTFGASLSSALSSLRQGAELRFEKLTVKAGGHLLLKKVTLKIGSGEQVAIVGRSGAGKSSLVGVLLGWHQPTFGQVLVDGTPLDEAEVEQLRRVTAWVDPAIELWNSPLLSNIQFGSAEHPLRPMAQVVTDADVVDVLDRLPDGFQTKLGYGGGLVSGGEGQRVRLARALLKRDTRLVLLDEPFRGLDRDRRRTLLARARSLWSGATLICVTHDVAETADFPRVLVVDDGKVVEDDAPSRLLARPSLYRALLEADVRASSGVWSGDRWRRVNVRGGRTTESKGETPS